MDRNKLLTGGCAAVIAGVICLAAAVSLRKEDGGENRIVLPEIDLSAGEAISELSGGNVCPMCKAASSEVGAALRYDGGAVEFSTPYGTFIPKEKVMTVNEYMTLNPTVLSFEQTLPYITADGDAEKAAEICSRIRRLSDEICQGIEDEGEKARAIAMWVGTHTAYDESAAKGEGADFSVTSLEAVLNNGRTTCVGFANLFAALCHSQGIYCVCMRGGSASTGYSRSEMETIPTNHAWNAYIADGKWYYADCAWISDLAWDGTKYTGGDNIIEFYAGFGFGEMSVEHRIDRSEVHCLGF